MTVIEAVLKTGHVDPVRIDHADIEVADEAIGHPAVRGIGFEFENAAGAAGETVSIKNKARHGDVGSVEGEPALALESRAPERIRVDEDGGLGGARSPQGFPDGGVGARRNLDRVRPAKEWMAVSQNHPPTPRRSGSRRRRGNS